MNDNRLYKNLLVKLSRKQYNDMKTQIKLDANKQTKTYDIYKLAKDKSINKQVILEYDFLNYYIVKETDEILLEKVLLFINNHTYKNVKIEYSKNFLQNVIKDNICMVFYDNDIFADNDNDIFSNSDDGIEILGIFFLKICDEISIQKNTFDFINSKCLYINWMFLSNQLYGTKNITKLLEMVKKLYIYNEEDIEYIVYKTNRHINKKMFYKQTYYYRPININKLLEKDMMYNDKDDIILKKIYNTFSYPVGFIKNYNIEKISSSFNYNVTELYSFIKEELYREYNIFEKFDETELRDLLDNDLFYKFVIKDVNTQKIQSFVCLYNIGFSKTYKWEDENLINGIIFCFFVKDTIENKSYVLEMISEYCYKHSICDMITVKNFLDIKVHEYKNFKLMRLNMDILYYIEKINDDDIIPIENKIYKNCFMKF